jgi:tetratricopeptide (TPR) repeat protein
MPSLSDFGVILDNFAERAYQFSALASLVVSAVAIASLKVILKRESPSTLRRITVDIVPSLVGLAIWLFGTFMVGPYFHRVYVRSLTAETTIAVFQLPGSGLEQIFGDMEVEDVILDDLDRTMTQLGEAGTVRTVGRMARNGPEVAEFYGGERPPLTLYGASYGGNETFTFELAALLPNVGIWAPDNTPLGELPGIVRLPFRAHVDSIMESRLRLRQWLKPVCAYALALNYIADNKDPSRALSLMQVAMADTILKYGGVASELGLLVLTEAFYRLKTYDSCLHYSAILSEIRKPSDDEFWSGVWPMIVETRRRCFEAMGIADSAYSCARRAFELTGTCYHFQLALAYANNSHDSSLVDSLLLLDWSECLDSKPLSEMLVAAAASRANLAFLRHFDSAYPNSFASVQVSVLNSVADLSWRQHDRNFARSTFERSLAHDSTQWAVKHSLASLYEIDGMDSTAYRTWSSMFRDSVRNMSVLEKWWQCAIRVGLSDNFLREIGVLEFDTADRKFVSLSCALVLSATKQWDSALVVLRSIVRDDSSYGRAYAAIAHIFNVRGQFDSAFHILELAAMWAPGSPHLFLMWGDAYRGVGDFEAAVACYGRAIANDSGFSAAYSSIAEVYLGMQAYDKVVAIGQIAQARGVGDVALFRHLGWAHLQLGNKTEAHAAFSKCLRMLRSPADEGKRREIKEALGQLDAS